MKFIYIKHAEDRITERGTNKNEVELSIRNGVRNPDKQNRIKFIHVLNFNKLRNGKKYNFKRIEVTAESVNKNTWKIITVIVKYY